MDNRFVKFTPLANVTKTYRDETLPEKYGNLIIETNGVHHRCSMVSADGNVSAERRMASLNLNNWDGLFNWVEVTDDTL